MSGSSFAKRIIIDDLKKNNKDLNIMPRKLLTKYIMTKYKCSKYYADQVIQEVFKEE